MNNKRITSELAELLALIIMFEQQIELAKQELAGYDEYDTRVAFLYIDQNRKGCINSQDIAEILRRLQNEFESLSNKSKNQIDVFITKYGDGQKISYSEFAREFKPKMNSQLAQTLMIRNITKKQLPTHIRAKFDKLVALYMILTFETQKIKHNLYINNSLNLVEVIRITKNIMRSENSIYRFIRQNGYEIEAKQVIYLKNHTKAITEFQDFTEYQLRQIFCPLQAVRRYQQTKLPQKINNIQYDTKKDNYLAYSHKNFFPPKEKNQQITTPISKNNITNSRLQEDIINESLDLPNIQHFVKTNMQNKINQHEYSIQKKAPSFEIDNFIMRPSEISKKKFERFQDDLDNYQDTSQRNAFEYI